MNSILFMRVIRDIFEVFERINKIIITETLETLQQGQRLRLETAH
jgi:hypothetical protein